MSKGAQSAEDLDLFEVEEDAKLGRIVRCAVEQNVSLHRFSLAVKDADRWSFDVVSAPTIEEAHRRGCVRCRTTALVQTAQAEVED